MVIKARNAMRKTRYIHIGYPKTGSTTLQNDFFAKHPEILHLGIPSPLSREVWNTIQVDVLYKDSLKYSPSHVKEALTPYLESADSDDKRTCVGISHEGLCMGGGLHVDRALIARRCQDVFGETKIIVIIRNQFDFLASMYQERIKAGCYFSFNAFLIGQYWTLYTSLFNTIDYYDMYRCYTALFGKEQVKVILFEDFKRQPDKTVREICSFFGISPTTLPISQENRGLSAFSLRAMHLINRLYKTN